MNRVAFVLLFLAAPLRAEELGELGLPQAAREIAKTAIAVAQEEGGLKIQVGRFNFDGDGDSDTDTAIQAELIRALADTYDARGAIKVGGGYIRSDGAVEITAKINRTDGKVLTSVKEKFKELTTTVAKISDQAKLVPGSKVIPQATPADPKEKKPTAKERAEALGKPATAFVRDGTLVQAKKDSLYAVEIRTKKAIDGPSTPLDASIRDGDAVVPEIPVGVLYEVRLLNYGVQEVSAQVSIDGLSEFHFTQDRKTDGTLRYVGTIVPPTVGNKPGEAVIVGWHDRFDTEKKTHHSLAFLVTEYGKGAVSKLPHPPRGKVGVVSVAFALSFPAGTVRGGGETGFGPPVARTGTVVKRVTDPPHEFVAVRYQRPRK